MKLQNKLLISNVNDQSRSDIFGNISTSLGSKSLPLFKLNSRWIQDVKQNLLVSNANPKICEDFDPSNEKTIPFLQQEGPSTSCKAVKNITYAHLSIYSLFYNNNTFYF